MMVTKIFIIITITVYSVHVYTECTVTLVVLLYVMWYEYDTYSTYDIIIRTVLILLKFSLISADL